jgi:hypothetical protein
VAVGRDRRGRRARLGLHISRVFIRVIPRDARVMMRSGADDKSESGEEVAAAEDDSERARVERAYVNAACETGSR